MKQISKRILCLAVVLALLSGFVVPARAMEQTESAPYGNITFEQTENYRVSAPLTGLEAEEEQAPEYADTDRVRVSVFLTEPSVMESGYDLQTASNSAQVAAHRQSLRSRQETVTAAIEKTTGESLDVVWNLTLAANVISANVEYGQISAIETIPGVAGVLIENQYQPDVVRTETVADPNMSTSPVQIGSSIAWAAGYTGLGSRIAIVDTGTDTDHQSFSAAGFQYALQLNAELNNMTLEEYVAALDLLDSAELAELAGELNVEIEPEQAYINQKLPYGYNYIDKDHDITHDNDPQGSHGSHVAGIAAANTWIQEEDGTFSRALESVKMQGVAPDAQILTMKVFGKNGGAYESDYMAAIEDALVLGCDAINLSLGSSSVGNSRNAYGAYQEIFDNLEKCGVVLAVSAGNNGYFGQYAFNLGYLYAEDASLATGGSPGSFTNSLTVASVDNDGYTSQYIQVGDHIIYYTERLYGNQRPMTYVAGEMPYVFIDGVGKAEDWDALGISLVGKIAICSRGENSFMDKITAALSRGAKAVIVYNNQPGVFGMDLTGNAYTWPSVSITQDDAARIRSQSQAVTNEAGEVLYYTGTMTVGRNPMATQYNSQYYTMSEFSSWGVPGSLELKPEITAPGGNIFSINGMDSTGTGYEVMSGTSMASPQVAGMAALMAQYIRQTNLEERTGLDARTLAQSLLMSTARPLVEETSGSYYAVMQQGSGLANIADAVAADSYVQMAEDMNAGATDGKIKVELGDDPQRQGVYDISFTLHNLTEQEQAFKLSGDFFTQDYFEDHNVNMGTVLEGMYNYMDTLTTPMPVVLTWTVDGKVIAPTGEVDGMDFNGDGLVNSLDGQQLLDYAVGVTTDLSSMKKADVDGDGDVDTHDAYRFFQALGTTSALLPAGGSVDVTVRVELTQQWDDMIETWGTNGLYVEGYLFAQTLTSEEGLLGTTHSIPVLGWYGNWTDPSMYDVDYIPFYVTKEDTMCPYVGMGTGFIVSYGGNGRRMTYAGNPTALDTRYLPERNAINSKNGTTIAGFSANLIRNAAGLRFTATNDTTGEVLAVREYGSMLGTYYVPSMGGWNVGLYAPEIYFKPLNLTEGDVLTLDMAMAPEYYMGDDGSMDWDALGKGAHYAVSMTVDNTAPEIRELALDAENNALVVSAWDNRYVAAVALYNAVGTAVLAKTGSLQDIAPDTTGQFVLPLEEISGSQFLMQVIDYANNVTTYVLNMELGRQEPLPQMMAFSNNNECWMGFEKTSTSSQMKTILTPGVNFYAATIAEHMVIAVDAAGMLYVLDEGNLAMGVPVANLGCIVTDLAYNEADEKVYGVTQEGNLISVDYMTAEVENLGEIGVTTNTLACDAEGTFYCNNLGGKAVYRFTLETMDAPELVVTTNVGNTSEIQSMEIDPNDGTLYWLSHYASKGLGFFARTSYYAYLYEIDTDAGTYTRRNNMNGSSLFQPSNERFRCLIIPKHDGGRTQWPEGTDNIHSIRFAQDSMTIVKSKDGRIRLSVSVLPWNAVAPELVYTVGDASILRVDNDGVLTGLKEGTTTVTAAVANNTAITTTCTVTVTAVDATLEGVVRTGAGTSQFFTWNLKTQDTWTPGSVIAMEVMSATKSANEDVWYMVDNTYNNWNIHKVNAGGEILEAGQPSGNKLPLQDLQFATYVSGDKELVGAIVDDRFVFPQDPMKLDTREFLSLGTRLVAMSTYGHQKDEIKDGFTGEVVGTLNYEHMVFLDCMGNIHTVKLLAADKVLGQTATYPSDLSIAFPGLSNMNESGCSMVTGSDGALYLSAFTGQTSELYRLSFNETERMYHAQFIGTMGEGAYPVLLTEVTADSPEAGTDSQPRTVQIQESTETRTDHVVTGLTADQLVPSSHSEVEDGEKTVTVHVTTETAANNGLTTVTWDAAKLALENAAISGDYTAKVEEDGKLTFGYVSLTEIPAGGTIATLTFQVLETVDTDVIVEYQQINNKIPGTGEILFVSYDHPNTETRNAVEATCDTEGYTGDVYCLDCGKLVKEGEVIPALGHTGELVNEKQPTCTEDGYTGDLVCSVCGETLEKGEVIPAFCPAKDFSDVDTRQWYHDGICFVVRNGFMKGVGEGIFAPNANLTRAELVTILYRMEGEPSVEGKTNPFADVAAGQWYTDAVIWAANEGIVKGLDDTTFAPTARITREQIATILYRYAGAEAVEEDALKGFTDAATVSDWAAEAMNWAVSVGLIKGLENHTLAPTGNATRAQIATILMRYCEG